LKISKIILNDEPSVPEIRITELAEFLNKKIGVDVEVRGSFLNHFNVKQKIASQIASCKVLNLYAPFEKHTPTIDEVAFEEQSSDESTHVNIVLYDGFELQNVLNSVIPESELSIDVLHIIFTTRLTCTFDYTDYRYHGRAVICSNPSIISTTGIIEAPAKPREYYLRLYEKFPQGLNLNSIKDEFRGKFLEHHDNNLGLVVRGYAMQAIFYYLTGQTFCESKDCMLYNAHWQEELLHSQIKIGTLCDQHKKILESVAL
jgi:hypothetical protein